MQELPKRKSLRLQGYDYSTDGCYFITICTENRKSMLSAPTIPNVVTALKKFTNRDCKINLWQRGYMDHIIRNQTDFEYHWNYIEYNVLKEYK